ncbi:hypothetical protein BDV27DRAFT_147371 [Aspergillus caelatus]|uniref:Major facilitator superfamily domain-containing protein n=1 Tax=Aspergillus caelatus TaxID=61420 RepID=A0A5N6ZWR5_9EURO|nr:uncharacterized protein BDV27DRAFT_147371 [Aspergillus caelatus]KAE8361962.1 hypothetical protein BDV27DRAFT_147371 [Aspergillus caelatus]
MQRGSWSWGAWCALFCSFGWINSIGEFQAYYEHNLLCQYSSSKISWIPSLQISFMFAVVLSDTPIAEPVSCIPSWFSKKRGAVYNIVSSGSSIGGVIFPIMISKLITILGVRMILLVAGFFILTFGIFVPMKYLVTTAMAEDVGRDLVEYLVAILKAGSGIFPDKISSYKIFLAVTSIAAIIVLALWIPASNNAGPIVFAILFGFATVLKLSPFPEIGYRTGLLFLFVSISGLTTNPIAGAILQHWDGSYTAMRIFSGVLLIIGFTLVLGVPSP